MKTTRRNFIKASVIAAVFAGSDLVASATGNSSAFGNLPDETLSDRLFSLTSEDFKKHIGGQFTLIRDKKVISAQLAEVVQTVRPIKIAQHLSGGSRRKLVRETFTLSFQTPDSDFSQETYRVWNPSLGQFDLFLVPGKNEGEQVFIHAVINRV